METCGRFQMTTPVFSRLACPWPSRRNPRAAEYRLRAANTLLEVGLITGQPTDRGTRRFEGVVVLDGYVYPYATPERLLAAGSFSQWLFFLDDEYDDHADLAREPARVCNLMKQAYEMLRTGQIPVAATPFARFTARLREQLLDLSPHNWMPRYLEHVRDYLFCGSLAAVEYWAARQVPATDAYMWLRLHDSAVFPALDMIEVAAGIDLPDHARQHPVISAMCELTVRHTAYVNDLFSFQKEVLWNGTPCNLVHVLMHNEQISFPNAVAKVVDVVNQDTARFLQLESMLPRWEPAVNSAVDAYVSGMKAWMRGNVDFSLASERYRSPDSPFLELRVLGNAERGSAPI